MLTVLGSGASKRPDGDQTQPLSGTKASLMTGNPVTTWFTEFLDGQIMWLFVAAVK